MIDLTPQFTRKDIDKPKVYMTAYPSGNHFHHFCPDFSEIDIVDIATHLANNCRYNGGVPFHYSVAYHSILCLRYYLKHTTNPTKKMQRTILLHDSAEAYWPDMHSMAKRHIPEYMKYLGVAEKMISRKYRCHYPEPRICKQIDAMMISTELVKLKKQRPSTAPPDLSVQFRKRTPESVRKEFLKIWETIKP